MSETGFRIFNRVFSAGAELTYAALLTAFWGPFTPARGRKRRKLLLVFSVYILFEIVCNRAALPQGSFGLILTALLLVEFRDGVLLQLYERHPAFLAVIPVLALLFYAGAYLTIAFQQGMAALREEQVALYAERQQTQAIRARIHEAERFYTRIRGLKHELRGHMTNIKALAGQGEYESLTDYIARMDGSISGFE